MLSENEEVHYLSEIEKVPSCSTSSTGHDIPKERPKFTRRGNAGNPNSRMQRSKSVPNASHMERTVSSNTSNGPCGLRMFDRSFSVEWSASRHDKMSSAPSDRGRNSSLQRPSSTGVHQDEPIGSDGLFLIESLEIPPPHYSSLDTSLDIVPICLSRMNYGSRANESDCIVNNDPPPSYRELFSSRMRRTVRHMSIHSTTSEFSQECSWKSIAKWFVIGIFFLGFSIVLPIAMVIQGFAHMDDCPIEPRIPIFLIVGGFLQMLECLGRLICKHCTQERQTSPENANKMALDPLLYILLILLVLCGFYIYQAHPSFDPEQRVPSLAGVSQTTAQNPATNESLRDLYCHESTFKLAYYIVTSYFAVLAVFLAGMLLLLLYSTYMAFREQQIIMGRQETDEEQASVTDT